MDVYSKTRRIERVSAVRREVEAIFAEPDGNEGKKKRTVTPFEGPSDSRTGVDWEPQGNPRPFRLARIQCNLWKHMVGERGFEPPTPCSRTGSKHYWKLVENEEL
jgi:hypothetical protein